MNETFASPLRLPILTSPYPDEILGSWLSRIRDANSEGAWRTLLENTGFGRRITRFLFDIVDYDEQLEALLTHLGTTFPQVLMELSTLPYWLTFSATENRTLLTGTTNIPALRRSAGVGEYASAKLLGIQCSSGKTIAPRYCPQCISQDATCIGQSYWHRAHQLPNVFFCHKHHCELHVKCPDCGARPSGSDSFAPPLLTSRCKCGCRLDQNRGSRNPSHMELRLVEISAQALNQNVPDWSRTDVFNFISKQLAQVTSNKRGRFQGVLSKAFSKENMQWRSHNYDTDDECRIRFRKYPSASSAPECCGLLAALDIGVQAAIVGFREAKAQDENLGRQPAIRTGTMTIEKSRVAMIRASQLYPSRPVLAARRHFWYLMLNDREWLREHFPGSGKAGIPTIREDRRAFLMKLEQTGIPFGKANFSARQSAAGFRASFRDKNWFDQQNERGRIKSANVRTNVSVSVLMDRALSMENALEEILSSEDRPTRIYASTLCPLVGLTPIQARNTINSVSDLAEAITKANEGMRRRRMMWAAKQLRLSGGCFSKTQLRTIAGVPYPEISDEFLAELKSIYLST